MRPTIDTQLDVHKQWIQRTLKTNGVHVLDSDIRWDGNHGFLIFGQPWREYMRDVLRGELG